MNKRGLNNIVTAVLLILLTIAATGILWGFMKGPLDQAAKSLQDFDLLSPEDNTELDLVQENINQTGGANLTEGPIVLQGMIEILHYDYFDESGSSNFYYLNNGEEKYWLNLSYEQRENLYAGTQVSINGSLVYDESLMRYINAEDIGVLGILESENTNLGEQKIALILVNFDSDEREPITEEESSAIMQEVSNYYSQVSYSQLSLISGSEDIYGWYTLPSCDKCSSSGLERVIEMADSDIDYENYDRIIIIYPSGPDFIPSGKNYAGKFRNEDSEDMMKVALATINTQEEAWNGQELLALKDVIKHELAHLLFNTAENHEIINHANGYECGAQSLTLEGCVEFEYLDYHDILGLKESFALGNNINSIIREKAGWLGSSGIQVYQSPGTYTLNSLDSPSGVKLIKIPIANQEYIYLEYSPGIENPGLIIHLDCLGNNCDPLYSETLLIDATPESNTNDFADSALTQGQSFFDPFNNLTISVISQTPSEITLSIAENHLCGNLVTEQEEECDDGNNLNGDGCSLNCGLEPDNGVYYRVFVSSQSFTGNLGGINIADNLCNTAAGNAGIRGLYGENSLWKAWISGSGQSASSGLIHIYKNYKMLDGKVIAVNWNDLVDGTLINPIIITEINSSLSGQAVWTGTLKNGSSALLNCNNWASSLSSIQGYRGIAAGTSLNWTEGVSACSSLAHLYCFEQPVCGNGISETSGEWCDDGNNNNGDGCSSDCRIENNNPPGGGDSGCTDIKCGEHKELANDPFSNAV